MKKKKVKIFSTWPKTFILYFSKTLNAADFRYVFRFFIPLLDQKLQPSEKGPLRPFFAIYRPFGPFSEGCNFWPKKDMKNLNTYLKSAAFKVLEKYRIKVFRQVEKIFIFFFFIFHLHFQISENSTKLTPSRSKLPFQRGITFSYIFFPSREMFK